MAPSSHASHDLGHRALKARKIWTLVADRVPGADPLRVLDVGAGSGAIAAYFARGLPRPTRVEAVDVADQRDEAGGYGFARYDGDRLPFSDASFDLVISNHVIEHVGDRAAQARHLAEIRRVLAPEGVAYLACPSRWQVVEPHFRLPFLSWLPRRWRSGYVRRAGRGAAYDCDPLGHRELEALLRQAGLQFLNLNAEALRATFAVEGGHGPLRRLAGAPLAWLQAAYRWSPTMVYLLGHRAAVPREAR